MKQVAAFRHLLNHYRSHKANLRLKAASGDKVQIALALGALDCLYWQALGNDLINLAKGINRTIVHSYRYHSMRLPCHSPVNQTSDNQNKEAA
ncbi:hypothetical protein [Shewanella putrefaciens]|uniref:Uncharacterized protein n=1 Tax=Shewanella putrefaciens TaxID=24 RepID=A0ABX8X7N1_SHEPU|nr:hypothetical protein [Shewanella putrefaciens]AVV81926.1 hypothetical protein SPWS13_0040 [Shewanella putrefaciens]MCT8943703.1 hypothetical protein [Shewanella putrefaciens]QSE48005.1 hypothetical protein JW975_11405 [Shewanella putrefaciens]QYX71408.1 hypothetical protein K3G22_11395 [Shewanella putrefaciens]GGN23079.1 hypothetical protein GCM10007984_23600 [Shewanella putrefaciens]